MGPTRILPVLILLSILLINCQGYQYDVLYYDQMPVDHFSFASNQTFSMRYLINKQYWSPNCPIFFYCGNEGDIELFAANTGFMWDIAPEFKAMVVFAEHRYYGKTMPFGNDSFTSPSNLGYLSTEQALADYAVFLTWLKSNISGAEQSPIIAFGGSYGGMLAAWIRMKYPNIILGSLAASAPILQFTGLTPCWKFSEITTRTFANSGKNCDLVIKKSWGAIKTLAKNESGRNFLNEQFHLCSDSQIKSESDVSGLLDWLSEGWSYLAMIDYPYPANFLRPVPAWPVMEACKFMTDIKGSNEQIVESVYKGISVYQNYSGSLSCYSTSENTSATQDLGVGGWDFQACTEMVMPMCNNGTDMFDPVEWNVQNYSDVCYKKFGVRPRPYWAATEFWGDKLASATNIIFSNGFLDPWSGGGVANTTAEGSIVVIISDGAHHYDLRGTDPRDTVAVIKARLTEKQLIRKWLQKYWKLTTNRATPMATWIPGQVAV